MKNDGAEIEFESKTEVENIMQAIEKYMQQNPEEKENSDLKQLYEYLDVMHMCW
jgi:hypothetical protein